ncbi:MAG TPA: hypothetical protein VLY45_03755 [Nitrospiria bacterium]|nr:hypothetical protein [Nitrospiria bacterium]
MNCPRCKGVMALERFCDLYDETGELCFMGWRCITCGEVVDPVIVRNRQHHRSVEAPPRSKPRRRHRQLV